MALLHFLLQTQFQVHEIVQHHPHVVALAFTWVAHEDDWIIRLAKFAVEQHNFKESKNLQYVRVLGASHTMVSSILYHITLETVDATKPKIYHAVVWLQILKNFMELLAWKPVNDRLSVLGVKSGDLKLHEAVMFYMNDVQRDRFLN
ncbi:cysteine proteinase inhibitor 12 isoform X2 [Prunus yedoensis var. nudiflora]|uniref:Cysteine proteinase inhibitor n=1 Tax=Prunus yedoensis var. nudiflora TaxID=2094558 RepID=A0A314UX66_PRUYE|nr:cysteine proteinase inhibitor 12 isoform X2 [Prunus yedoensis var. nudiflora]